MQEERNVAETGGVEWSDVGGAESGRTWKDEIRVMLALALPVMAAQISQTGMNLIDTVMSARVSDMDMAAVATGSSVWFPVVLFAIGVLLAVSPVVAHLHGAGEENKVGGVVGQGMFLAAGLSVGVMLVLSFTRELVELSSLQVQPKLLDMAVEYMDAMVWGVPAVMMFVVLRGLNEGLSMTKPAMVIGVVGLLCNIPLNYMFIFGKFGAPALGGPGCGVATAIVNWLMFFMMLVYVLNSRKHRANKSLSFAWKLEWTRLRELIRIGLPIGSGLFFEVSSFAIVALLVAAKLPDSLSAFQDTPWLGVTGVACHNIALNVSALLFMIPMAIATAVTVRVGKNLGAGSSPGAKLSAGVGTWLALSLGAASAICVWLFRGPIARAYTVDPSLAIQAGSLLLFAAIYQVSDFTQVVGAGILRGYKDTRALMLISFLSYWGVSLATGFVLGRTDWIVEPMGARGFWIGFIAGLTVASGLFLWRILVIQKKYTMGVIKL